MLTPRQQKRYRAEWGKTCAVAGWDSKDDSFRRQWHLDHGLPSSTTLFNAKNQKDFDTFLALCAAIHNPSSVDAQLRQLRQDRTRKLHWIEHSSHTPEYIHALCRDKFGLDIATADHGEFAGLDFTFLTNDQLNQLHLTLKNRHPKSRSVLECASPLALSAQPELATQPF